MSNNIISVIVPSYNHEIYVEKCLESIFLQTYKKIELIVIDDNSTDKTALIIENFIENNKDRFLKTVFIRREKNQGLVKNLNYALSICQGDFICSTASDDYMGANRFTKVIEEFNKDDSIGFIFSDQYNVNDDGKVLSLASDNFCFKDGNIFEQIITREFYVPAPTLICRSGALKEIGYDPRVKIEDWILLCKLSSKYKAKYISEPLVYYRVHDTNTHKNVKFMDAETDRAVSFIMTELSVSEELVKIHNNNLRFRRSKNISRGLVRSKISFFSALCAKIQGKMTAPIGYKDWLKFFFKWI